MALKFYAIRTANLFVIFTCMTIMQYHGIQFWLQYIEWWVAAFGWSLGLELVSFWCWFQKRESHSWLQHWAIVRPIAFIATLLLLVGPLYEVGHEVVENYESFYIQSGSYQEERQVILDQIQQKQEQSERLIGVVEERNDGYNTYNRLQDDIAQLRQDLRNLKPPADRSTIPWQELIVVGMQGLALIIFQSVLVIGILKTAAMRLPEANAAPVEAPQEQPRRGPMTYKELLERRENDS